MKQLYHGEKANAYLEYIFGLERKAARESDLLFATSEDERNSFIELYGVPPEKIVLAPNGIDPEEIVPVAKRGKTSVLFIGSHHPPNVEAVDFIIEKVAAQCPRVDFLIAGTCCDSFRTTPSVENIRLLGRVDEKTKRELFASADIALNPMFSGAGTNLKTLEFLSAGLPLLSTDTGVRGLGLRDGEHFLRADRDDFAKRLLELIGDTSLRERIGHSGQCYVNDHYSWKNIADTVRASLERLPADREKSRKRILLLNDYSAANPKGGGEDQQIIRSTVTLP
jgi:glycosyltransferase involved in cell wall biosynthesis